MNALYQQKGDMFTVKTTGTYSNQWTLKDKSTVVTVRTTFLT